MYNKFAICIPTLNQVDILIPYLILYSKNCPNAAIYVYDNGKQNIIDKLTVIKNIMPDSYPNLNNIVVLGNEGKNIGVAGAWNVLLEKSFEHNDYAFVLNDDIFLDKNEFELDRIIAAFDVHSNVAMYLPEYHYDWSVFLMPKKIYELTGKFDENFFPAYYEDNDYEYRLKLKNLLYLRFPVLNPVIFKKSQTTRKEPNLFNLTIDEVRKYYLKKWGGMPNHEIFTTEFGY